jgi:hypothetical protein
MILLRRSTAGKRSNIVARLMLETLGVASLKEMDYDWKYKEEA